ncbi:nicotinate (nicotinamide) nucleotide adenylyltransferase [Luteolibacter sp. GHJ8]|uniref:Probable nicotinate-nucleotide adenylyltransferase n=1 Tax=Luteolibacter rhizosphaerae TaxID=2989719 RepID=A0ABT3G736_9BACT|nr:nicotinate (nicotinamide) nucleotide adenylyltransferase [Luteolibacter rhizosphaerae]MCW1915671.1 nicotinate (nicotinamide) nucleotide adenylyltransferase [Luteolibacter rhizosphaerae]
MSARRIALFGGTFDPIHEGHLRIAVEAQRLFALDEVRFLPCQVSPHKVGVLTAPAEERLEMVRLAIAGLPWATVDSYDLFRPQPAYSWQTAEEMARREPEAKLFWLMGYDQWTALPRWQHPERLAAQVDFLVSSRAGIPEPHPQWRMQSLAVDHPASSTAIRQAIAAGETGPWLPPAVAAYIAARGLYKG